MTSSHRMESMGLACGVDLVDIASFGRALEATGGEMARVCFTDLERRDAGGRVESLAGRWAVKEAVTKAIGTGLLKGIGFHDVEVSIGDGGCLNLTLHGEARRLAKDRRLDRWAISLSHEGCHAVGFAIAAQSAGHGPTVNGEEERDD